MHFTTHIDVYANEGIQHNFIVVLRTLTEVVKRSENNRSSSPPFLVELGSGTGYVGIAAAALG